MSLVEGLVVLGSLAICGAGIGWLLIDLHNQLKYYDIAQAERCEGLVEDDEEEEM